MTDTLTKQGYEWLMRDGQAEFRGVMEDDKETPIEGIIATASDVESGTEIGRDARELACLEVKRPVPRGTFSGTDRSLNYNDRIQNEDRTDTWTVIRRQDNPADRLVVKYWLAKVVHGVDGV